ncbi:MAG: histidinol-phosphate transaminase [Spongiibacteraceae bacterium]|jgi:histidinol-phosphate aminotransferase|nr:histidinol-phosphate transaminase [Spongiibacteraceae bacterium]
MAQRFWSDFVAGLTPYVPGEQPTHPRLVKLNTNEHPCGPSPRVLEAIRAETDARLRLYPDPTSARLRDAIARYYGVGSDCVFVGNGSDEVLAHIFHALLKHALPVLFPDISYSFYPVYCGLYGIRYETVALNDALAIDVADYARPNAGIVLPNPNAPTGCLLGLEAIEALAASQPDSLIVVDEAYVDFGGETAIPLVARHDNLLVVQTLSKSRSLAGLRVGFAVGQAPLIEALVRVKDSFNSYPLDRLAEAAAIAAFEDEAYFQASRRLVIDNRAALVAGLAARGFALLPSAANFVFARHPRHTGANLAAALREQGVIVRHFNRPRIDAYLRITVGTAEQQQRLFEALDSAGVGPVG